MRVLAPLAVLFCAAGGAPLFQQPGQIDLSGFEVVIMGEVHDNPAHHTNQAGWIERLAPRAVVFEMLTPALATVADTWHGDPADLGLALGWSERGWPDFSLYAPVFEAISTNTGIFGGDVARETLRAAMTDGAAAAFGDAAPLFALDQPLAGPEQAAREAEMAVSHCGALPPAHLPAMVEAQRLRDAALAEAVFAALQTAGAPVAVITGNGHARTDWGLIVPLRAIFPEVRVLSIGQVEQMPSADLPHDVLTLSAAPERGDPCAAFR